MTSEPTTPEAIDEWIRAHVAASDVFADVAAATEAHRVEHGCDAFAGGDGPLLRVLAAAIRPRCCLEVGTGLGYATLSLAAGAGEHAVVETIEADAVHAELALANFVAHGIAGQITIHSGIDLDVLPRLDGPYDFVFYDAAIPAPGHLVAFDRVLAPAGVLVTSNLFLGRYVPDDPRLPAGAAYRERLFGEGWTTAFIGGKALTVRAAGSRPA